MGSIKLNKGKIKTPPLPPISAEIVDTVISATCIHFGITKKQLCKGKGSVQRMGGVRHLSYYIIATSGADIYDYQIGYFFDRSRCSVRHGVSQIAVQKNIYSQTLADLNSIINIANNFTKKHSWHLQPINITS